MQRIANTIRKDSYALGAFIALVSPMLTLIVLYYFFMFVSVLADLRPYQIDRFYLLSITANLFLMRYYLVGLKRDKTGKSILVVTFILVILFFYFSKLI